MMFSGEIVTLSLLNAIVAFDNVLSGHTIILGSFRYLWVKHLTANKMAGNARLSRALAEIGHYALTIKFVH
jgi:hypothetical protein